MRRAALTAGAVILLLVAPAFAQTDSTGSRAAKVILAGSIRDAHGPPVGGAEVDLEGSRRAQVLSDRRGAWSLPLELGALDDLLRSPLELWLDARAEGARVVLANGAQRLRFELRAFDDSLGARRVRVRSNDRDVSARLARAIEAGARGDTIVVNFVANPGAEGEPVDVPMGFSESARIAPGRVIAVDSGATPPKGLPGLDSSAAGNKAASAIPAPAGAVSHDAPSAASDTCGCRIEGTIEVQSNRPLPERVPISVWLEDAPAERDSVELALGSPRGFTLNAKGCAAHRVMYRIHSHLHFHLVSPRPVVRCDGRRLRQVSIVLAPTLRVP